MFIETIIATFALGGICGMLYAYFAAIRPLNNELYRLERKWARETRQRRYKAEAAATHRGTPYIRTGYTNVHQLMPWADEERWRVLADAGVRIVDGQPVYSAEFLNDGQAS